MILQRLAASIRKQDWFTVVIETLIVVFGVYLGIQLGNWNAARAERAQGERLIERLYEEMTTSLETEEHCITRMEQYLETARSTYEALRTRQLGEGGEAGFRKDFESIGPWTDLCIIRSTLDELQGGQIALVSDEALKFRILDFNDRMAGTETTIENLGATHMTSLQIIFAEVDYAWGGEERRLVTDFEDMADNPNLVRNLETTTFMFSNILRYHESFDQRLHELHEALAEYLGEETKRAP